MQELRKPLCSRRSTSIARLTTRGNKTKVTDFRIHNRGDLTGAPGERLIEIPPWIFTPERLSLLLLFSDRPLEKASVQDLELPPTSRALAWADIIAEDPLTEDIGEGVDFGAEQQGVVRSQWASPAFAA